MMGAASEPTQGNHAVTPTTRSVFLVRAPRRPSVRPCACNLRHNGVARVPKPHGRTATPTGPPRSRQPRADSFARLNPTSDGKLRCPSLPPAQPVPRRRGLHPLLDSGLKEHPRSGRVAPSPKLDACPRRGRSTGGRTRGVTRRAWHPFGDWVRLRSIRNPSRTRSSDERR
jgi:hypothetical protein